MARCPSVSSRGPKGRVSRALLDDHTLPVIAVCDEPGVRVERVAPFGHAPFTLALPDVTRLGGTLMHWLHVLEVNVAFLHTLRRRRGAVGKKNVKEKGARIHGTAHVAGTLLGAGAEIEAGASVIDSYIGPGVKIAAHSVVVGSVIGQGCHTLIDTHLRRVVAFPGSTLSNVGTTDALFGREIFITTGVQFFAGEPGRTVVVEGVDTGRPVLSGAIGHKTILGARALFQAGVAVPSGSVIVMRPDEGATKLDERGLARASMMRGDPSVDY
jgi:carbonic anhydrase/acetyltransferase-like protein (isoleucine patch superfamily)